MHNVLYTSNEEKVKGCYIARQARMYNLSKFDDDAERLGDGPNKEC